MGEIRDLALDMISGDILQAAGNFSSEFKGGSQGWRYSFETFF